jgi:hypothetical protein
MLKTVESSIKNDNLHPKWVAGFSKTTGESNFFIAAALQEKSKTKSGLSISLRFSIAQH